MLPAETTWKRNVIWRIAITTTVEAEDAVTHLISSVFNERAASYRDVETSTVTVAVYCDRKPSDLPAKYTALTRGILQISNCGLNVGPASVFVRRILREDWAESWKRHFKPVEFSRTLMIKPSWSRRRSRQNQAVVVLDPGLSFGTGQHPTTAFCLREIVRHSHGLEREPSRLTALRLRREHSNPLRSPASAAAATRGRSRSFLDIGTGSGILAIAAAKLGYSPVHAFDFDPDAVRVARANARLNDVLMRLRISRRDMTRLPARPASRYDLVCANLISTLLIAERRRIVRLLKPDGVLVLAGILKDEFAPVAKAYKASGLHLVRSRTEKEWRSGAFRR